MEPKTVVGSKLAQKSKRSEHESSDNGSRDLKIAFLQKVNLIGKPLGVFWLSILTPRQTIRSTKQQELFC